MEEDDDDIYDPADLQPDTISANGQVKAEELEEGEEEDDGAEDESDDEINFITDAKTEPKQELLSQVKRQVSTSVPPSTAPTAELRAKPSTPVSSIKVESTVDRRTSQVTPDRPGTDYPGRHTSTIDPNANPIHPVSGKPILSTDFDADFPSESTKPWRKPGSDITDYFNYGFDEFTWASYCLKQQQMPKEITEIKSQAESLKSFVEGIGPSMPGMAGAPSQPTGGMPQMPGMPSEAEMQQMFSGMMSQGMNPATMDPSQFMQMMMGGGGPTAPGFGAPDGGFGGQPSQQQQGNFGGGGFNQQGGGGSYRGRGRGRW